MMLKTTQLYYIPIQNISSKHWICKQKLQFNLSIFISWLVHSVLKGKLPLSSEYDVNQVFLRCCISTRWINFGL
jgi:hypothetical protein